MTTALTIRQVTPDVWRMIETIAPAMHESRLFGVTSKHQAAAIMLKGYELGFSLTASFEFIHTVQGKPTLSPRGHLALILGNPEFDGIKVEESNGTCSVWMKRRNGFEHTITFSLEDAKRAGVVKSDSGWEKYPSNMLRWRTIGFCADVVFPDVGAGMKRADEFGANITPDGDVIEGDWQHTTYTEQPQFTPEQIMQANDGRIPASDEELKAAIEKLQKGQGEDV